MATSQLLSYLVEQRRSHHSPERQRDARLTDLTGHATRRVESTWYQWTPKKESLLRKYSNPKKDREHVFERINIE